MNTLFSNPIQPESLPIMGRALMKSYSHIKEQYKDCLVLFRVGDFYECFGSDAEKVAEVLGIVLAKTKEDISLAGFFHYHLELYLGKLVRAKLRVAICDQLEDPTKAQYFKKNKAA